MLLKHVSAIKDSRRCNCCVVFVGERKKSTSLQLLSVTSNLMIHMCGYSLQLQILLSQTLLFCNKNTFIKCFCMLFVFI